MDKKDYLSRINKINGQIKGIQLMIKKNRDCLEIIQQIQAAKSALSSLAQKILVSTSCNLAKQDKHKFELLIKKLSNLS